MAKTKKLAWSWCSKYIRLRDSIECCKRLGVPLDSGFAQCCTCGKVIQWKYGDAGHFISRGSRGASGVYFDERNINFQCKPCNGFKQGNAQAYQDFMLEKYGQEVIDQLRCLDVSQSYKYKLVGLEIYYKQVYQELVESL